MFSSRQNKEGEKQFVMSLSSRPPPSFLCLFSGVGAGADRMGLWQEEEEEGRTLTDGSLLHTPSLLFVCIRKGGEGVPPSSQQETRKEEEEKIRRLRKGARA